MKLLKGKKASWINKKVDEVELTNEEEKEIQNGGKGGKKAEQKGDKK